MSGDDVVGRIARRYRHFAEREARGRSPRYEDWASRVAADHDVLGFLAELPEPKRQPNLLFAAARWLDHTPRTYQQFREVMLSRRSELRQVMLERRTQTNEPARCATLLPALAALPQPLALLEVGASAGLALLPDRYNYDFAGHVLTSPDPDAPTLRCQPRGPVPLPERLPTVAWRAGLDLNPLDVHDDADVAWLRCLIWPGEAGREERLAAAIQVARRDPPRVVRGDLVDDLPALAAEAPPDATLVVFHSAVLVYVPPARRRAFAATVAELGAVWLSNEGPGVLADLLTEPAPPAGTDPFLLIRDSRTPLGFTDGHGRWVRWLER